MGTLGLNTFFCNWILDLLTGWPQVVRVGMKRFGMGPRILKKFYSCTIESIFTAASPLGMANTQPSTAKRYRRWCGKPSTSLGPSSLLSRTSIPGGVRGRPIKLSKIPATQVIVFSLLLQGKLYRSAKSLTKRLLNSFYPQSIRAPEWRSGPWFEFRLNHIQP